MRKLGVGTILLAIATCLLPIDEGSAALRIGANPSAPSREAQDPESAGTLWVGPGQTLEIGSGEVLRHRGRIVVFGDGRLLIRGGELFLDGHLAVSGQGVVAVTGGKLHLEGNDTHVFLLDEASLSFTAQATLHYVQSYVHQHVIFAYDRTSILFEESIVDCDGSAESVELHDEARFVARSTVYRDWTTWYMWDDSSLILEGVFNAGDIVFYDRPRITVKDSVGVMPWMYFPAGSVGDLTLPDTQDCQLASLLIDDSEVAGIGWSLAIENSACVALGVNPYPGSDITVRDTLLSMALIRFEGDQPYVIPGEFKNGEYHADTTFSSVPDRDLRLVNSTVEWWKIDAVDQARVVANDITFSEMMVKDRARVLLTNSTCEGQTIHLGAVDESIAHFRSGEVWSYVSTWDRAAMILEDSLVDHTQGEYIHQYTNIAHHDSRLYALNTEFVSPENDPGGALPRATDRALVLFARLGMLKPASVRGRIPIRGSAWLRTGPESPVRFHRYTLSIRPRGETQWRPFWSGTRRAERMRVLGWLVPSRLELGPGLYEIGLTVQVKGDDPSTLTPTEKYPAVRVIRLY